MLNLLSFAVLMWILYTPQVSGIIGYDCGSTHLNVTTLSLLDVENYNIPLTQPQIEKTYIQLLQLSRFESVEVIQCKVSINRFIYYCGMHSHLSTVMNAQTKYILEITAEQCKKMHLTGIFSIDINKHGLKVNQTTMRPTTFAGFANLDGQCLGAQYSDPYGAWDNVIVQGTTTITLTSYQTSINLETNQIRLKSGTICVRKKILPTDHCKFNHYDVLYEGHPKLLILKIFLNDGWYHMTLTPEYSLPPTIMKPMTKPTWHYTNPGSLAASGSDHIMFPAEKGGILNAMARGVKGQPIAYQGISLSHLLDESTIQKITENTWKKIWGNFISFGNASAGIIGIYFCIRTVKLIIDTLIHGYAIHTIYGWALHLIGALWDSITNLIIHLS
ncbi:hypothetical protein ALC60_02139 [Trachymyrmex zeteki]|uniref:Glycoprotein n=1 Tax=Mycetomoellerius zeteki TaxID=64791 RepID=A0A151XEQ8_9HYME|nr:hypothetical protein ALC60_02139 [Trachymyrmex zeteki]